MTREELITALTAMRRICSSGQYKAIAASDVALMCTHVLQVVQTERPATATEKLFAKIPVMWILDYHGVCIKATQLAIESGFIPQQHIDESRARLKAVTDWLSEYDAHQSGNHIG